MNSDELQRALSRPDIHTLIRQIDAYAEYFSSGAKEWPDEFSDDFDEISLSGNIDPDKALAYIIISASRTDDAKFLGFLGCGPLEDLLCNPSVDLMDRIVEEARRSPRFRWLLSNPFKIAVAERAWALIEPFRITGPHEEPSPNLLPPRDGVSI